MPWRSPSCSFIWTLYGDFPFNFNKMLITKWFYADSIYIFKEFRKVKICGECISNLTTNHHGIFLIMSSLRVSIGRVNSEDFSNSLWCLVIISSTYYYERTHKNVQKNHNLQKKENVIKSHERKRKFKQSHNSIAVWINSWLWIRSLWSRNGSRVGSRNWSRNGRLNKMDGTV